MGWVRIVWLVLNSKGDANPNLDNFKIEPKYLLLPQRNCKMECEIEHILKIDGGIYAMLYSFLGTCKLYME